MSRYRFEEENGEPVIHFMLNGTPKGLDYENTTLFTHGNDRHIDHIFVEYEPAEGERYRALGAFIFRQTLDDFDDLANDMISLDYPHVHMPYPNEFDLRSYEESGLVHEAQEPKVIVEEEDDDVVAEAIKNLDAEIEYFLGEQ
jgi:hypothetical protein